MKKNIFTDEKMRITHKRPTYNRKKYQRGLTKILPKMNIVNTCFINCHCDVYSLCDSEDQIKWFKDPTSERGPSLQLESHVSASQW